MECENIVLTLDERFKDLRVARKETLESVSEHTGIAKSTIARYENMGDNHKDAYSVAVSARYYGVSADYLLRLVNHA